MSVHRGNYIHVPATLTFRSSLRSSCKSSADLGANVVGDIDIVEDDVILRRFLCYLNGFVEYTINNESARWKGGEREKNIPIDARGTDGRAGV